MRKKACCNISMIMDIYAITIDRLNTFISYITPFYQLFFSFDESFGYTTSLYLKTDELKKYNIVLYNGYHNNKEYLKQIYDNNYDIVPCMNKPFIHCDVVYDNGRKRINIYTYVTKCFVRGNVINDTLVRCLLSLYFNLKLDSYELHIITKEVVVEVLDQTFEFKL